MSDSAYAAHAGDFDHHYDDGFDDEQFGGDELPGRPRRQLLNRWSAAAVALLTGAAGFYIGVRVEKSNVTGGGSSGLSSLAARFASGPRAGGTAAARLASSGTAASTAGGTRAAGGGAAAGAFPGGFGRGNAAFGTVASVSGNTLYVKESDGNTVKVKLSSATTITKRETVGRAKVYPGDAVVLQTAKGSGGALLATALTDSGPSGSGSSGSGSSGSGSSGSGSSGSGAAAIKSLFGGG